MRMSGQLFELVSRPLHLLRLIHCLISLHQLRHATKYVILPILSCLLLLFADIFRHVAVRVRPPLNPDDPGFDLIPQRFQRSMVQTTSNTSLAIDSPQGKKLFVFDRVFGPEVMQDGIWDYLAESITAFTQGYNVSLLAYGQSGAGKSYTMGTSNPDDDDPDGMGMFTRLILGLHGAKF